MSISFAPMEGITGSLYRRVHQQCFGGIDRYYTPFLAPGSVGTLRKRECREVDPAENAGVTLVPQLLTNRSGDFLGAAQRLADLGYREVNLNLGCPSGTVVAKGRGAGMLDDPLALEHFLDELFANPPLAISIKTRIGMESRDEFPDLLEIYNRYPIRELTVHPRVRSEYYKGRADWGAFRQAVELCQCPLCYNGDLFTVEDVTAFHKAFPTVTAVMIGRGLLANPAFGEQLTGTGMLTAERLKIFHDRLLAEYCGALSGERSVLFKMKELWQYWGCMFQEPKPYLKRIRKAQHLSDYESAVSSLFAAQPLLPNQGYCPGSVL